MSKSQYKTTMTNTYMQQLKELILSHFDQDEVTIVLFGSRARKEHKKYSDVDIGLIPARGIDEKVITLLKEKIENSNIPYKVDIININEVTEDFRKQILKDAVTWSD